MYIILTVKESDRGIEVPTSPLQRGVERKHSNLNST